MKQWAHIHCVSVQEFIGLQKIWENNLIWCWNDRYVPFISAKKDSFKLDEMLHSFI